MDHTTGSVVRSLGDRVVVPLAMGWRHLLFENWPIDPDAMAPRLPDRLTVDVHDGSAWLTLVPFVNVGLRPRGMPAPFGIRLPHLNVRTYVTHDGVPGVYFFSINARSIGGVLVARLLHYFPYYYARTSLRLVDGRTEFAAHRWHPGNRPATYEGRYWPIETPFSSFDDAITEFLFERYRFYTETPDGSIRTTTVAHDPWTLYAAGTDITTNTFLSAHGVDCPAADPVYYYSPGVDVVASRSKRVS